MSSLLDYSRDNKGLRTRRLQESSGKEDRKVEDDLGRDEEERSRWCGVTGVFSCFLKS